MYCKKCGTQLDDNAQFCPSCGAKQENKGYTAPQPFAKNSIDESQNYQYQKTTFRGKQFSAGNSGNVEFSHITKKTGFIRKILRFIFIFVIAITAFDIFFGDSGPIYNISFSESIDAEYYPIDPSSRFSSTATNIPYSRISNAPSHRSSRCLVYMK